MACTALGGSAAAAVITPPVNGVVGPSAPTTFGNADAEEAAEKLTVPVLYLTTFLKTTLP